VPPREVDLERTTYVSRGFRGRRAADVDPARVPPGQYVTADFPVLSAGPTPHTSLEQWDFSIVGELDEPRSWAWEEFRALPSEEIIRDIHCVTKWSKLGTVWRGVSVDTLLEGIETEAEYVTQYSNGGYTTNLPLEDITGGKAARKRPPHREDGYQAQRSRELLRQLYRATSEFSLHERKVRIRPRRPGA
jgi:DMSO/TMAO reductase YedYZ molybdopterin-dependent catalytic subunit